MQELVTTQSQLVLVQTALRQASASDSITAGAGNDTIAVRATVRIQSMQVQVQQLLSQLVWQTALQRYWQRSIVAGAAYSVTAPTQSMQALATTQLQQAQVQTLLPLALVMTSSMQVTVPTQWMLVQEITQ
jgi:hypothetical protein